MSTILKITPQKRVYYGGIIIMLFVVGLFLFPSTLFIQLGLLFVIGTLFVLFLFNLEWGLYCLVATSIFYGWEVYFSQYEIAKNISYLASINAPLVDLVTLILGGCTGLAWFLQLRDFKLQKLWTIKHVIVSYGLFVAWGILSVLHAGHGGEGAGLKYLLRPIVFAFLGFVILPILLIQKKETLLMCLKISFWVGVGTALFGLSSVIVAPQAGWLRIVPYGIGNFAPLGYNHNMIAEALVTFIPLAGYLTLRAYQQKQRWKGYLAGGIVMFIIALLTLSRAAWLSLMVEGILVFIFFKKQIISFIKERKLFFMWITTVIGVAILGYMAVFLTSSVVSSSNAARWQMTDITLFYFKRAPLLGYGPGTYINILGSTFEFVVEFGEPLESHGFIQKILLEEGAVGLLLFALTIFFIFYRVTHFLFLKHQNRLLLQALLIMMFGGVIFQLFDTSYFKSVMWLPMGLGLAATLLEEEEWS